MYRKIVVPLDGSIFGEHALPLAVSIARRSGAAVHLVHVHSPLEAVYLEGAGYFDDALDEHLKRQHREYMDGLVKRLRSLCPGGADAELLEGAVAPVLEQHASKIGADLVIMTTHGRGPFKRFWLGSVADELVRSLPMPLLLVHPGDRPPDLASDPVLKHVLVPLDGTPLAESMLGPAMELGTLMGAEFTLLRVIKPVMPVTYRPEGLGIDLEAQVLIERVERIQGELRKKAEEYLFEVSKRFRDRLLKVHTKVEVEYNPADAILAHAKAANVDLIALETHGRHGLRRLILGSITDKVIRASHVAVMVHRPLNT